MKTILNAGRYSTNLHPKDILKGLYKIKTSKKDRETEETPTTEPWPKKEEDQEEEEIDYLWKNDMCIKNNLYN